MKYLHWEISAGPGNIVNVDLDSAANVVLLDDAGFSAFQRGDSYSYYGGHYTRTPVRLSPPRTGRWHVVVHLGGYAGQVGARVAVA